MVPAIWYPLLEATFTLTECIPYSLPDMTYSGIPLELSGLGGDIKAAI
ncbi:Hypothetical protein Cul05146_1128 [Corynebacterium ulcerans]|nr:Hypothetical protein Cul05146_1128 [Corynebacterium ulcerans]